MPSVTEIIKLESWWSLEGYGLAVSFHITGWEEGYGFLGDLYIGPQRTKRIRIAIDPLAFEQLIESGEIREATDPGTGR